MLRVPFFAIVLACAGQIAAADQFGPMLNDWREGRNLHALRASPELARAAAAHAADMGRRGFFSHTGSDGSSASDRARRAGFRACALAENIAKGQAGPSGALQGWVASRPHRRNMTHRRMTHYGYAEGPGRVHVLMLGAPC